MAKRKRKENPEKELLIDDLEGAAHENENAPFGACIHGIADDDDCVACRSKSCTGGADCDCAERDHVRKRLAHI